jgi:hypothetical protein
MALTRRDALKTLGALSLVGSAAPLAAGPRSGPTPIVTAGGTRLYPAWPTPGGTAPWWTAQPLLNGSWTVPQDTTTTPSPQYLFDAVPSLGAGGVADTPGGLQDVRNTPRHGEFTRAYLQFATRPLAAAVTLDGTVSAAVHCLQWHRRINGRLALQVVVHDAAGNLRAVALPVTADTQAFTLGTPARTRAAINWPVTPVECQIGDVIAVTLGILADNQTRTLAQGVGLYLYSRLTPPVTDIAAVDTDAVGRSWVEFSAALAFVGDVTA